MGRSANERYHDRVAARYDDVYEDDPFHSFCREISLRHLRPYLPRDLAERVLDAGCGTGFFGARLARSGYRVDSLDLSQKMLDRARRRHEELGLAGEARFLHGDLEDARDLGDGAYGLVIAQGDVLSFVGDADRAVKGLFRVLAPGGIVFASLDQRFAGLDFYTSKGDLEALGRFVRDGRSVWLGGNQDERFPTRMFTPAETRALFDRHGFEVVSLIGRTVLPLREHRRLLEDKDARRRLLALEEKLHKVEAALGRASHLEVVARRGP